MNQASIHDFEARRQAVQTALDADRSQEERNRLGQFATPPDLAREVARAALTFATDPIRFFDPAIGSGAFFSALLDLRGNRPIASARGIEPDERFVRAARELWSEAGLVVTEGDFTRIAAPGSQAERANLILANPPYVRHHHLDRSWKVQLKRRAEAMLRRKVSGLSGLYVYFVLLADEWMADGGVAAWLLPGEWMDVNYGSALKEYLCNRVTLLRVHRFDSSDVQFRDALVSSTVVFFRQQAPADRTTCEMTAGALSRPGRRQRVSVAELVRAPKWSPYFQPARRGQGARSPSVTVGDYFDVKRGIATGGNRFFVRPREEFRELGIPDAFLRPVLPSSRQLVGTVIERARDGYPAIDVPLALLDCRLPAEEVQRSFPELWRYLDSSEGRRVRVGYLTRGRRPWYAQERRQPAPIVATYMGRGSRRGKPFRFFWNRSDATATNVYLLLIPKREVAEVLRAQPGRGQAVLDFFEATDLSELQGHGRVYGGGLHKLEPRELAGLNAERLAEALRLPTRHQRDPGAPAQA